MESLEYLLLFMPLIVHLLIDKYGKVNHKLNGWVAVGLSVVIGFLVPYYYYFWQGTVYALTIHFVFFDFAYNVVHKHPFFYHGDPENPDRAIFDKLWTKGLTPPPAEVFIKLWILSVGASIYYALDRFPWFENFLK